MLLHSPLEFKRLHKWMAESTDAVWQYVYSHRYMCSRTWACSQHKKHAATGSNLEGRVWTVGPLLWNWRGGIDLEQRSRDSKWQSKCLQPWTPQASANFRNIIKSVSFSSSLEFGINLQSWDLGGVKRKGGKKGDKRVPFATLICCCHIHFRRQRPRADSATLRTPASTYCSSAHSRGAFVVMVERYSGRTNECITCP